MKGSKRLNIKGTPLDKIQLEQYLAKVATDHDIIQNSDIETYPILHLKEDFYFITKVYNLLNEHIKLGIQVYPAGEWILDNFYIIEETFKMLEKEITHKKYIELPRNCKWSI